MQATADRHEDFHRAMLRARVPDPCARQPATAHVPGSRALPDVTFRRLVSWMHAHIDAPLTEMDLCARTTLPLVDFIEAYARRAGMAPMRHLRWMRVDLAVRLLVDTRFDLEEIAYVTGLGDVAALEQACLETMRIRPQALRVSLAPLPA